MTARRVIRIVLIALLVALAATWYVQRDRLHATWQAATIAGAVEEVPVGSRVTRAFTKEPGTAATVTVGGLPATRLRAGGGGAAPAIALLVPGDTSKGDLDDIEAVQLGMARAGFTAWAVRVGTSDAGSASLEQDVPIAAALAAIAADPSTADGAVSVVAGGTDASRALVAAATPKLRAKVRAVLVVQPVADVQGLVRLAVTGQTRGADGRDVAHPAAGKVRGDAGQSIVQLVRDRAQGLSAAESAALDEVEASDDPIAAFGELPAEYLGDDLRAIRTLLTATDPAAFDAAWQQLPDDLLAEARRLSPLDVAGDVDARVLVLEPARDTAYPAADGSRLAGALPHARVRVSPLITTDGAVQAETSEVRALLGDATWWLDAAND